MHPRKHETAHRGASSRRILHLACAVCAVVFAGSASPIAQSDLDAFMRQVLEQRDANWKKLQQYVLDEREQVDLRGPGGAPLWGEQRDYTWYVRDGFFIRSPLRVNGSSVSESDRLDYERRYLERERNREVLAQADRATPSSGSPGATDVAPDGVDGLITQSRWPQFISSAYFLRFTFDEGRYALVGRERLDGEDVLRIEYYPKALFKEDRRRDRQTERRPDSAGADISDRARQAELRRLMNTSSKVTLWIEPASHQIVKYTFEDLGWNFFPAQWLTQMDSATASMTMGQPFTGVWLPHAVEVRVGMLMALGNVDLRYSLQYEHYRQPDVRSTIRIPDTP